MLKRSRERSRSEFSLREVTLTDVGKLVQHRRGMFEDMRVGNRRALDASDAVYRKWIKLALRRGTVVGWLAEVRGQVAASGCIWLQPALPNPERQTPLIRPYLFSMYTEPQFRRMGVASRIVREAIAWSQRNGYPCIILHASKKGRGLYRKHGFTRGWEMGRKLKVGHG
jgi:GNAT superfamily N-acetyltransferase